MRGRFVSVKCMNFSTMVLAIHSCNHITHCMLVSLSRIHDLSTETRKFGMVHMRMVQTDTVNYLHLHDRANTCTLLCRRNALQSPNRSVTKSNGRQSQGCKKTSQLHAAHRASTCSGNVVTYTWTAALAQDGRTYCLLAPSRRQKVRNLACMPAGEPVASRFAWLSAAACFARQDLTCGCPSSWPFRIQQRYVPTLLSPPGLIRQITL